MNRADRKNEPHYCRVLVTRKALELRGEQKSSQVLLMRACNTAEDARSPA